ncbi:MAG: ATP-binding protein, partial [Firmicutes bacterium]|nr:ATP-binding protein [Bacillota bacterium]
ACSTAAGPAFEGAQITCGMGGTKGAIEGVDLIDGELKLQIIDGGPAKGICGSGLIDIIALLLQVGIIDETGRMLPPDELPDEVPTDLRRRVVEGERGVEFILTRKQESPVVLTQGDVRELQLAKGAIYAGIKILMKEAQLTPQDISRVILAGAFGNYVRKESAIAIGLLPLAEKDKIVSVGNAARMGARMALLSQEVRGRAVRAAAATRYVELSGRLDFQMEFAEAMFFPSPGGDLDKIQPA